MSFFNIFKKKKTTEKNIDAANEPITWKNTTNASDFFEGYKTQLQLDFIERFEKEIHSKTAGIQDIDTRTKIVIDAISSIRKYNSEMPIAVRTRLAQAKKNLIGE